jgi:hypothetical protein
MSDKGINQSIVQEIFLRWVILSKSVGSFIEERKFYFCTWDQLVLDIIRCNWNVVLAYPFDTWKKPMKLMSTAENKPRVVHRTEKEKNPMSFFLVI